MTDLTSILSGGVRSLSKTWPLVFLLALFEVASTLAGLFPFLLVVAVFIRLFLAAPIHPVTGQADLFGLWQAYRGNHMIILCFSGLVATVWGLQFVLTTFAKAGLIGELGECIRDRREGGLGGFLRNAQRLFGRVAVWRLLLHLGGLILLAGWVGGVFALVELSEASAPSGAAAALFPNITVFSAFYVMGTVLLLLPFLLFHFAFTASLAMEDTTIRQAFGQAIRHLRKHEGAMLVFYALTVIFMACFQILGTGGTIWWFIMAGRAPQAGWPGLASTAWDLSLLVAGQLLWILSLSWQLELYRQNLPPERPDTPEDFGIRAVHSAESLSLE